MSYALLLFMLIDLDGPKSASLAEMLLVAVKMLVLTGFAVAGLVFVQPALLSPSTYSPMSMVFYSLAITFFAYEGFRIITNAAEDMADPKRMLPRAIMTSVAIVMVLYVAIALAVFGNMPAAKVIALKYLALARAPEPIFGELGFRVVAIAALLSTASAINAALYAITNVTYQLAKVGDHPVDCLSQREITLSAGIRQRPVHQCRVDRTVTAPPDRTPHTSAHRFCAAATCPARISAGEVAGRRSRPETGRPRCAAHPHRDVSKRSLRVFILSRCVISTTSSSARSLVCSSGTRNFPSR